MSCFVGRRDFPSLKTESKKGEVTMNASEFRRRNESESIGGSTDRRRSSEEQAKSLDLSQFYGTETYYKHPFSRVVYADGVQYFAKNAADGIFQFLDDCLIFFPEEFKNQDFLSIELKVKNGIAIATVTDGNNHVLNKSEYIARFFHYEGTYKFYLTDDVLMLASEY